MTISVTGLGIISSIGQNLEDNYNSLLKGKSGIVLCDYSTQGNIRAGKIPFSDERLKFTAKLNKNCNINRSTLLGVIAASEAWEGHQEHSEIRTGFISGAAYGVTNLGDSFYADTKAKKEYFLKTHDCGASTDYIANIIGINGFRSTISTACSSSANAILYGARLIESNILDRVIVGGADSLNEFTIEGFKSLMLYDEQECRPFDENRNGLNLGEGAAYIVLENDKSMSISKREKIVELTGWGNACDSFHPTGSSPNGIGASIAIKQALKKAKIDSKEVDYINAHGTGTKNNDASECASMYDVFENTVPSFSSTKGYTGHTLAAAGAIEAVFSILSIRHNVIFPSLNFSTPMSNIELVPEKELIVKRNVNIVLSSSFGFGGNCTELIFSA